MSGTMSVMNVATDLQFLSLQFINVVLNLNGRFKIFFFAISTCRFFWTVRVVFRLFLNIFI